MKTRRLISTIALLCLACGAAAAQTAGGSYQFTLEDGRTKYVEFDARAQSDGGATGRMFFSDDAPLAEQDTDGVGDPVQTYPGFYFSAEFDGMTVSGSQAVISGTVRDSSITGLIGRRVLLTVEDNGDNTRQPDRVTWGVYADARRGWTPSDAELRDDPGVGMTWTATDAERDDDRGVRVPGDDSIGVGTFPLASYEFVVTASGSGDIVVRP
ncbi:MAG TPA: hypothetical protein VF586_09265 [Pyrinomonadaceae bacterium]